MDATKKYELWLKRATADHDIIAELKTIAGNESEIQDRFYKELEFGTGGLRGVLGAGTNRLNVYTIGKVTQGLATYLSKPNASCAIAYDSRNKSKEFAWHAARVLAANGIKVYLFSELTPTPMLSYAVRYFGCHGGIVITASHNPAKYNGFKCYGSDGCQMTDESASTVLSIINHVDIFDGVEIMDFDAACQSGSIVFIGSDMHKDYMQALIDASPNPGVCCGDGLKVVYTPLYGAGNVPVREILNRIGADVVVVKEQENPDGNFPTCPYPNPEIRQAFEEALKVAAVEEPDILLATDPDCDRVGIAVKVDGDYLLMSGNEVGALLADYIISMRTENGTMPKDPVIITTIVTSALGSMIARRKGCEVRNVLTGFKYIGEQMTAMEASGHPERFLLGYEESYGYLIGTHVRDKDAVVASMVICEMAAHYKKQNLTLVDVMNRLYCEYGWYEHALLNFEFEGAQGMGKMNELLEHLRKDPPIQFAEHSVVELADYLKSVHYDALTAVKTEIHLPKSNVLSYTLDNGASMIVRPSGTEPKLKIYLSAAENSKDASLKMIEDLKGSAKETLGL